jgi:hypothetical protein
MSKQKTGLDGVFEGCLIAVGVIAFIFVCSAAVYLLGGK